MDIQHLRDYYEKHNLSLLQLAQYICDSYNLDKVITDSQYSLEQVLDNISKAVTIFADMILNPEFNLGNKIFGKDSLLLEHLNNLHTNSKVNYSGKIKIYYQSLNDAMRYSLLSSGKMLRPALVFIVGSLYFDNTAQNLISALAIECIHTYSLIHDDLPAMDNDTYRRGKPTNHLVFGEGQAILAGDALQSLAFGLLSNCEVNDEKLCTKNEINNSKFIFSDDNEIEYSKEQILRLKYQLAQIKAKIEACNLLSYGAGNLGMCLGQSYDLLSENILKENNEIGFTLNKTQASALLTEIHYRKTAFLIRTAVQLGTCTANLLITGAKSSKVKDFISRWAFTLGLAFQVKDDLLDVEGDLTTTGKNSSDLDKNKLTYTSTLGIEKTYIELERLVKICCTCISQLKDLLLQQLQSFNISEILEVNPELQEILNSYISYNSININNSNSLLSYDKININNNEELRRILSNRINSVILRLNQLTNYVVKRSK